MAEAPRKLDYMAPEPGIRRQRDWITIAVNAALCGMGMLGGACVLYLAAERLWSWLPH